MPRKKYWNQLGFHIPGIALMAVLLIFYATSCRGEKVGTTYYFEEDMADVFRCKKGSYWIYQNDSLGLRDTVILLREWDFVEKFGFEDGDGFETIYQWKSSTYFGRTMLQVAKAGCFFAFLYYHEDSSGTLFYRHPKHQGDCLHMNTSSQRVRTLSVRDTIYLDVVHTLNDSVSWFGGVPVHYYHARNVGLVKWEIEGSDTVWELVGYSIQR